MLHVSEHLLREFSAARCAQLAERISAAFPALGSVQAAQRYVAEAQSAGVETERDIAEFTGLLFPVDRTGRPVDVDAIVQDATVGGPLKVFQIRYALHGERP